MYFTKDHHIFFEIHVREGCNPNPGGLGAESLLSQGQSEACKQIIQYMYNITRCSIFTHWKLVGTSKSNKSLNTYLRRKVNCVKS